MRTPEVFAALDYLKARVSTKWPLDQFCQALDRRGFEGWEIEGRWQIMNASLNGIKTAFAKVSHCLGETCRPTERTTAGILVKAWKSGAVTWAGAGGGSGEVKSELS